MCSLEEYENLKKEMRQNINLLATLHDQDYNTLKAEKQDVENEKIADQKKFMSQKNEYSKKCFFFFYRVFLFSYKFFLSF